MVLDLFILGVLTGGSEYVGEGITIIQTYSCNFYLSSGIKFVAKMKALTTYLLACPVPARRTACSWLALFQLVELHAHGKTYHNTTCTAYHHHVL